MSETTTVETTSTVEQSPAKENMLKRFAKAFYAKVSTAAKAVKATFAHLGDNETPVDPNEGAFRKALRYVMAVPKWIGHAIVFIAKVMLTALFLVVLVAVTAIAMLVGSVAGLLYLAAMTVFKVIQGIALLARTPYLMVRGDDCLRTDYVGYGNLWKPKYFPFTTISQVYYAKKLEREAAFEAAAEAWMQETADGLADAAEQAAGVVDEPAPAPKERHLKTVKEKDPAQQPKGHATPKQPHRRPRRLPKTAPAMA